MTIFSYPISFSTLKCLCLHFYSINLFFFIIQIPVTHTATRRTLLYFPSSTKKDWHHSRAWGRGQNKQFIGTEVMVQHLVEDMTSTSVIMPTVTLIHTQTFITATTTYQVEYRTGKQSLLDPTLSHLMRWRCFISPESHDTENRGLVMELI